jgi:hypothetical protein
MIYRPQGLLGSWTLMRRRRKPQQTHSDISPRAEVP